MNNTLKPNMVAYLRKNRLITLINNWEVYFLGSKVILLNPNTQDYLILELKRNIPNLLNTYNEVLKDELEYLLRQMNKFYEEKIDKDRLQNKIIQFNLKDNHTRVLNLSNLAK